MIGARFSDSCCGKNTRSHATLRPGVDARDCCFRYSNPSQICWQLSEADEAHEYRKFRGLNKRQFAFMAASEALQVTAMELGGRE